MTKLYKTFLLLVVMFLFCIGVGKITYGSLNLEVDIKRIEPQTEITDEVQEEPFVAESTPVKNYLPRFKAYQIELTEKLGVENFLESITEITTEYIEIEREPEYSAKEAFDKGLVQYYTPDYYPQYLTSKTINNEYNRKLLKQLLACEGGGTFDGYVWTCSCILNLCDYYNMDLESIAYDYNLFTLTHTNSREDQKNFIWNFHYNNVLANEAVEYVLNGHRVSDIKWWKTGGFHHWSSGPVSVAHVGGHYFSK